jgi:YD repeat-containing protein
VQGLLPEKKYIITAWVHDPDLPISSETITNAEIRVVFNAGTVFGGDAQPSGPIIDGWQQIECEFTTPTTFYDFNIELNSLDDEIYFDDVRMFPYDGSMKCYVYDPENLRFVAELDERHFATFYEYDEEGRLTRIKKETERGIMTIQESKTSTVKRPNE